MAREARGGGHFHNKETIFALELDREGASPLSSDVSVFGNILAIDMQNTNTGVAGECALKRMAYGGIAPVRDGAVDVIQQRGSNQQARIQPIRGHGPRADQRPHEQRAARADGAESVADGGLDETAHNILIATTMTAARAQRRPRRSLRASPRSTRTTPRPPSVRPSAEPDDRKEHH